MLSLVIISVRVGHVATLSTQSNTLLIWQYLAATISLLMLGCATIPTQATSPSLTAPDITFTTASEYQFSSATIPLPAEESPPVLAESFSEASSFLVDLSADDIDIIRTEAERVTNNRWQDINARSQIFYARMLDVAKQLDAPKMLLFVPVAESGYNPYALSHAGASGLWQLMPKTARELGAIHKNGIDERRHVEESTRAALSYLMKLYEKFESWPLAICAYNLGPWGVEKRLRDKPWHPDMGLDALPFPAETRHYVKQILGMIAMAEQGDIAFVEPLHTEAISIQAPIDLISLTAIAGLEGNAIFTFNPEFDYQHYLHQNITLHLPAENISRLEKALEINPDIFKPQYIQRKIRTGDSLWLLARDVGTSVKHLRQLNPGLGSTLRVGKNITVPATPSMFGSSAKPNPLLSKGRRIYYKVKPGDSLWTIAQKFGTSTHAIARINQMPKDKLIRPGDKLWILARIQPQ